MDQRDIQQLIDAGEVTTSLQDGDILLIARPNQQRGDKYSILAIDKKYFSAPYKTYTALLNQTGTNAPSSTVVFNSLGDLKFSRIAPGDYLVHSDKLFTKDKYSLFITPHDTYDFAVSWIDESTIEILTDGGGDTLADGLLEGNTTFEVRVYN